MNKIRKAREALSLTQTELAVSVGCSQVHISNLESGRDFASRNLAKRLADKLNINIEQVLFPEECESVQTVSALKPQRKNDKRKDGHR